MTESDNSNGKRDWNAMIYLAGENNLAEECVSALKGLKRARPLSGDRNSGIDVAQLADAEARIKVVAQLDAGGLGGDEVRYILKRPDVDGELWKNEITRVDTTETTYRGVLKDFIASSIIKDGRAAFYLLVLSGHGNGVIDDFLSRDVDIPDKLSIPKIQWVLDEVKQDLISKFGDEFDGFKINVLGLDSCMMSMAEIGYELRKYVDFTVGAEGYEPNSGWPYEQVLSEIMTQPNIQPDALAVKIVERYVNYYRDFVPAARSVDLSACDLRKCDELANAVRELADVMYAKITNKNDPAGAAETLRHIVLAHWEAQSYKDDQYVDLYDFCDLLDQGYKESPDNPLTGSVIMRNLQVDDVIRTACQKVKKVLVGDATNANGMILKSCYSGPAVQYSHGLSVYFPWSNVVDTYKELEFAKDTHWRKFLLTYIELTRRGTRPCPFATKVKEADKQEVVKGRLFFNPAVAGFDFILTENKDATRVNRVMSNRVGSMKNPAIDYVPCTCPKEKTNGSVDPPVASDPKPAEGESSDPEEPAKTSEPTESSETSESPESPDPEEDPGIDESSFESSGPPSPRARKK